MKCLRIAALLSFMLAIGHVACMFFLEKALQFYKVSGNVHALCGQSETIPLLLTALIALSFAVAGCYALSAASDLPRLPLLRLGVGCCAAVFLLRALIGIIGLFISFSWLSLSSVLIALVIGILFLPGVRKRCAQ